MNTREVKAVDLLSKGYNCSQAVLGAFCDDGDSELGINTALKLANGFGGGLCCGEVCGAVSGGVMVIGLKCGFYVEKDLARKTFCNMKSYEFIEKFTKEHNSPLCRDLLGIDVRTPEDHKTPEAQEARKTVCANAVAAAVRILEQMNFDME